MKKLIACFAVAMVLAWTGAFFFVKAHRDGIRDAAGSIAGHLKVPASWIELSQDIDQERFICLDRNRCPSLSLAWQADRVLDIKDLERLGESSGWHFRIDGTCKRSSAAVGLSSVCSARAEYDGYRIQLQVDSPDEGSASLVRMSLRPAHG